ncbi:helix-turn-helix domain-containing protein [Segnochrobactraceae bacterium EtOH-i3]
MTNPERSYKSEALQAIHEIADDLFQHGLITKETMRTFDVGCLTPVVDLDPDAIRAIREQSGMSQAIFARALNVTTSLVSKWERGEKKPGGPSLKLLTLARTKGIDAIL